MTCQLNLLAQIAEVDTLKQFLFPDKHFKLENEPAADADVDFDWDQEDWGEEEKSKGEPVETTSWLSDCVVSISPLADLLLIGYQSRLAVLECTWEDGNESPSFRKSWKGIVSEFPNEHVTSLLCLPIVSHKQTTQGAPEWTCVIAGFDTGYVRMYTEAGSRLVNQHFHTEPVVQLRCKTYARPPHVGASETHEEMVVLYEHSMVVVDGVVLFTYLKACRNQAAKAAASQSGFIQPPPLPFKHWGLGSQELLADGAIAGEYVINPFDQMATASLHGFHERVSSNPPRTVIYVCGGDNPYVGFYHILEGEDVPLINNVTQAASKLISIGTSALVSWGSSWGSRLIGKPEETGGSEHNPSQPQQKREPAVPQEPRYSLYDKKRTCLYVSLSPHGRLAAVTDSLGRVILLDIERGVAVRQWKGYRSAQTAWVRVGEGGGRKGPRGSGRVALFLAIYAPKRGLLEVWLSQQGPRVAAFSCQKDCTLLHVNTTMLGLNGAIARAHKGAAEFLTCCFLRPSGEIFSLDIPFHLALSDSNSKSAHDLQLLKVIKSSLKRGDDESLTKAFLSELWSWVSKLKLTRSRLQAVESICLTKYMTSDGARFILGKLLDQMDHVGEPDSMGIELNNLYTTCKKLVRILDSYECVKQWHKDMATPEEDEPADQLERTAQVVIHLEESRRFAEDERKQSRVQFSPPDMNPALFMSIFYYSGSDRLPSTPSTPSDQPSTASSGVKCLEDESRQSLGLFLFLPFMTGRTSLEATFTVARDDLSLTLEDTLTLLLSFHFSPLRPSLSPFYLHKLESAVEKLQTRWLLEHLPPHSDSDTSTGSPSQNLSSSSSVKEEEVSCWARRLLSSCQQQTNVSGAIVLALTARSLSFKGQEETQRKMNKDLAELSVENSANADQEMTEAECDSTNKTQSPPEKPARDNLSQPEGDNSCDPETKSSLSRNEWQYFSLDASAWDVCLDRLVCVGYLNRVLRWSPGSTASAGSPVCVQDLLKGSKGIVSELVGRWAAGSKLEPSFFSLLDCVDQADTSNTADSNRKLQENPLLALSEVFPLSFSTDSLYANIAWEYIVGWQKDLEALSSLCLSVEFLKKICSPVLQHGICSLMWDTFLKKKFKDVALLIEKVHKAPKDRISQKELDMDTASATEFTGQVYEFLGVFCDANCSLGPHQQQQPGGGAGGPSVESLEELWLCFEAEGRPSTPSLVEMSCGKRETNYLLLTLHSTLAFILHGILTFSLKAVRPLKDLFDKNCVNALFTDLMSHPYLTSMEGGQILAEPRLHFFVKLMAAAVAHLPPYEDYVLPSGGLVADATETWRIWSQKILDMGHILKLDVDFLATSQVVELYTRGHDLLGADALLKVPSKGRGDACEHLLEISGRRLAYYLFSADDADKIADCASRMSPQLYNWLKGLDYTELKRWDLSLAQTKTVVLTVLDHKKEGSKNFEKSLELVDILKQLC